MQRSSNAPPDLSAAELLAAIDHGLLVIDAGWRLTYVNPAGADLLHRRVEDLVGESLWTAFPGAVGGPVEVALRRAADLGAPEILTEFVPELSTWFSVRAQPVRTGLAVAFTPIDRDQRAAQRAAAYADVQSALRRVATAVAAAASPDAVHRIVCRDAARLVEGDVAWLLRFDAPGRARVLGAHAPALSETPRAGADLALQRDGEIAQVAATGMSVAIADGAGGLPRGFGLRAAVVVPVRADGEVWGALCVAWRNPRPDADAVRPWLVDLADLVSLAVGNAEHAREAGRLSFWPRALDALSLHLAVIDERGIVIAVNEAWRRAGRVALGHDYLAACEALGTPMALELRAALDDILAGRREEFESSYDVGGRWFRGRARRLTCDGVTRVVIQHDDHSRQRTAEDKVRFQARLLDEVDAAVVATDVHDGIVCFNRAAEELFGWRAEEALGRRIGELIPASDLDAVAALQDDVEARGAAAAELVVPTRDGREVPVLTRHRLMFDAAGQRIGRLSVTVDLSERMRYERELESARDYLDAVTSSMADGLLVLGGDGRVNLANRSAAGLLRRDGEDLRGAIVADALYGGAGGALAGAPAEGSEDDEFVRGDGSTLPVTWTSSPLSGEDETGHVIVFQDATERRDRERRLEREAEGLRWATRIRRALDGDELELFAQPIMDLRTGAVTHHELLLRLRDGAGGHIAPGEFLPAAEEHGLMADLDVWVLRRAVELAAEGRALHVNLSSQSIGDRGVLDALSEALEDAAVDPRQIIVEVTETAVMASGGDARGFLRWLREMGCGIALDDFGTGYNSFARVKDLPTDVLKIDRQFVADLLENPASVSVVRAMVLLAGDLGVATVAEGIEDEATLERLRELGVESGQGFHLGRPAPLA